MERLPEIVSLVEEGDVFALLFVITLFSFVGTRAVASHNELRLWGWRLGFLAFVGFETLFIVAYGVSDAGQVAYSTFRAILAGALTVTVSWCGLALLWFAYSHTLGIFFKQLRLRAQMRRNAREAETRQQRREQQDEQRSEQTYREREDSQEREEAKKEEVRQRDRIRKHRDQLRLQLTLKYESLTTGAQAQMARERFDAILGQYLVDDLAVDSLDERAQMIEEMLDNLVASSSSHAKDRFKTVTEIYDLFDPQLDALQQRDDIDADERDTLLKRLEQEMRRTLREFGQ